MKVGIFNITSGKSQQYIDIYQKILRHNNIDFTVLNFNENFWKELNNIDFYIHRFIGTDQDIYMANSILPIIEFELKKPCYPDFKTYWSYEDKIKEYFLMSSNEFPMAKSFIFFDKNEALSWIDRKSVFPIIFKLKAGAGSTNVIKVKNKAQAGRLIRRLFGKGVSDQGIPGFSNLKFFNFQSLKKYFGIKILTYLGSYNKWPVWQIHKNYVIFQEFLPNNEYDTRVTTIGKRAFAFRRMNRKNDFRSSGSGIIDYNLDAVDMACVKIALQISRNMQFQTMAYDFLYDTEKKPVFCELSYTFNDRAIYNAEGYWDEELNFHKGNFWPQYFQIKDLLNIKDLKQPEIL